MRSRSEDASTFSIPLSTRPKYQRAIHGVMTAMEPARPEASLEAAGETT